MEIKHIILHQIIREDSDEPSLNLSAHLLDETNETVNDFMERLIKSFRSKNPTYGMFENDEDNYPFQKWVKGYIEENNFLSFSKKAMETLKKAIQVPKAKGGYVLFAHYIEKQVDYIVTIMLDKSAQFAINDDNLDIKKLETLDIDKLARANRLNVTKWQETKDETYLAFIKGTRDVSNYFQKFIGSTDLTSSKINANNLRTALNKYMREKNFSEDKKETVFNNINDYIEKQRTNDEDVHLSSISAFLSTESPNAFTEYIQSHDDLEVSGNFRVARKSDFSYFHKATVVETGYKLEFEKDLKRQNKIVREGNNIVIKNVPKEILDDEFGAIS